MKKLVLIACTPVACTACAVGCVFGRAPKDGGLAFAMIDKACIFHDDNCFDTCKSVRFLNGQAGQLAASVKEKHLAALVSK